MASPLRRTTCVSCPGKVLIAGGYLVLDPSYTGAVVATSSRFYTVVETLEGEQGGTAEDAWEVEVRSPQFKGARWRYVGKGKEASDGGKDADFEQVSSPGLSTSTNKFVQLALSESVRLALAFSPIQPLSLRITVVGDNDFYSQARSSSSPSPFQPLDTTIQDVHKTGLGSSAAMVTSLSSALLLHLVPSLSSTRTDTKRLLHNLAQYVHSLAQGKVGSGFDVSAAVWGSHGYGRFDEACLGPLLSSTNPSPNTLLHILSPDSNPEWSAPDSKATVEPFSLPPLTTLLLADVDAGSHTPSMVGKVLAWRKANRDQADRLWQSLAVHNDALRDHFQQLNRFYASDQRAYELAISAELSGSAHRPDDSSEISSGPVSRTVDMIRDSTSSVRQKMREMGELAGVPIEPDEQTRLLDACEGVRGVLGSGVPGAGGYDAIWVLVLSPALSASSGNPKTEPSPADKVRRIWSSWTEMSVNPLSDDACVVGGEEEEAGKDGVDGGGRRKGMSMEEVDRVKGLRAAVEREVEPA